MSVQAWFNRVWYERPSPPWWLRPLGIAYGWLAALRRVLYAKHLRKSIRVPRPVIVVGNLTVGGTGKTPLVAWLVEHLRSLGFSPGVVTRGYGGSTTGVRLVESFDDPRMVGDEPMMLARRTGVPIAVGRDRPAAANLLIACGCDVIVSDDGLQHYALARDCEIIVIDGARRFGNGLLLPAGPLRESPARLACANAIVMNCGASRTEHREITGNAFSMRLDGDLALPVVSAIRGAGGRALSEFAGQSVHAIAGIGNPERYFSLLRAKGIRVDAHALADHAQLTGGDICFQDRWPVFMTEKDAVKCASFAGAQHWYVPVEASFEAGESDALLAIVARAIANSRPPC